MKRRTLLILIFCLIFNFSDSFAQFGKNKVQYEKFKWRYVETEHFDMYFAEGGDYLANYTAIEAEKALRKIESALNFKLTRRISFVVFNSHNEFQQNNVIGQFLSEGIGGVTQLYKNNIVIPFQGNYTQFQHVIFHELVHGVLNDLFHGGTLQSSISNNGFFIPSWLNEGLCEYLSYDGLDPATDMFMRDIIISESFVPLERLDGYIQYRVGQTFYWYIADKYGKEKVGDFINRLRIQKNLNSAFESSFNLNFKDFSEKFEKDLKKYYLPDLEKFKDLDDFATPVAKRKELKNFFNSAPAISPDGEQMAFITDDNGVYSIATMRIGDKNSIKYLVSSFRKQDFEDLNMLSPGISWSPKGDKIAVSAKSGPEDAIFIVNPKNGDYEKLTFKLKMIESVQWSPDGRTLAFVGSKFEQGDIYLYDFYTKKLTNLTNDLFTDLHPTWSPNSKTVYFVSDRDNELNLDKNKSNYRFWNHNPTKSDVYKINLDSKKVDRLTIDYENNKSSLAVNSDNTKLLFVSDENGISNLYELTLASGEIRPLTNSLSAITQISLSREDSKLIFSTQNDAGYDIYMLRYPFNLKLDSNNLPLTKLKANQKAKKTFVNSIAKKVNGKEAESDETKLPSYGDFQIDFSGQKLVEPNPDATKKSAAQDVVDLDTLLSSKPYKLKFSTDYIMTNPTYSTYFGLQGSTYMQFSDELGDHVINALANFFIDLKNSSFILAYNYLPNVVDYQFMGYMQPGYFTRSDSYLYRFRKVGLGVTASYPLDLFQRFEFSTNFMNVSRDNLTIPNVNDVSKFLIVPQARFVYDDVLYGMYAPNKGTRLFIDATMSPKLGSGGSGFATFSTDIRNYQKIGQYITFASRVSSGISVGPNARNFFLGGTENWIGATFGPVDPRLGAQNFIPFDEPEDFAFLNNFVMPARGFGVGELQGNKYFMTNFELRFPLLTALVAGPLPILIQGVMGSIFLDVGGAWKDKFTANSVVVDEFGNTIRKRQDLLMSTGFGIRSYLFGMPMKLDIAWRNEVYAWSLPNYIFSIGYDF